MRNVISLIVLIFLSMPHAGLADGTVSLAEYRLSHGPVTVKGVKENLSGLTFNPRTGTIFGIINNPTVIVEMDVRGVVKRTIALKGFNDTEGIAWIEGDRFAVLEERRRKLIIVHIGATTASLNYSGKEAHIIDRAPAENKGPEGLCYDAGRKRFYSVKEKRPFKLYEIAIDKGRADIKKPWDIEKAGLKVSDLSGIYYNQKTGSLLILSDESKCVVETTHDGKVLSRLSLKAGDSGLRETLPQPEGIVMDDDGNIYVCSEPNKLYVFSPAR